MKNTSKKKPFKYAAVSCDWKEASPDFLEEQEVRLATLGIVTLQDPRFEGSDTYGMIYCNRKPNKKELAKVYKDLGCDENGGIDEESEE